jgi:putative oxidoreductase
MKTQNKTFDFTLLFVRISLGFIIAAHGAQKLLGWFGGFGYEGTMGFFTSVIGIPYLLAFLVIVLESLGMIALMAGFASRVICVSLIAIMIGAIITTHASHGFFMNWFGSQGGEGFEYHLLIMALAVVIVVNGSGIYSIDHLLAMKAFRKSNAKRALA